MRLVNEESVGGESQATLVNHEVLVSLTDGFPYLPPKVVTNLEVPRTWHQERDGGLCLYTSRDRDGLPWLDPDAFLERIALWFVKNGQGWPEDPPALDLEAYLDLSFDPRLIVFSDLDRFSGYVTLRSEGGRVLRLLGPGKAAKKRSRELTGYVADLGPLTEPPQDWASLFDRLDASAVLRGHIERGRIDVLLVRYQRAFQRGVLAVTFTAVKREPRIALSAGADRVSMGLRSGPASEDLGGKHVYVIGAGALGSHICDGLSRAGIGRLTIRDSDYLTPGNFTRHFVTEFSQCGVNKASAVKSVLENQLYNRAEIGDVQNALISPAEALEILEGDHFVVDATGDGAITAMLEAAARITGRRFITTCLQNDGRTQRVDVVPSLGESRPLSPTQPLPRLGPEVFEGGCGEPVSPTPPFAVAEAAAMAVRHIVGHLTGRPPSPSGEVRQYL